MCRLSYSYRVLTGPHILFDRLTGSILRQYHPPLYADKYKVECGMSSDMRYIVCSSQDGRLFV